MLPRVEGRHDGLKEVILHSEQMTRLILGIFIVLADEVPLHNLCPHTYGTETRLRRDFQGYSTV